MTSDFVVPPAEKHHAINSPTMRRAKKGMGGDIVPPFVPGAPGGVAAARNAAPLYSNIVDRYSNRNVCFSCGFDEEDGHTSRMCPHAWRRANH